jgi:hypothetical protein
MRNSKLQAIDFYYFFMIIQGICIFRTCTKCSLFTLNNDSIQIICIELVLYASELHTAEVSYKMRV